MGRPAKHTGEDMLDAAERVVAALGARALTFDAIAREAGVSKGAVLHYFDTKEAIVSAMVERLVERLAPRPDPHGSDGALAVRRLIARARAEPGSRDPTASGLLAAVTLDLSVLEPIRRANRELLDRLAQTHDATDAALLHFALDGLWLSELLGISPLTDTERHRFFDRLLEHHGPIDTRSRKE